MEHDEDDLSRLGVGKQKYRTVRIVNRVMLMRHPSARPTGSRPFEVQQYAVNAGLSGHLYIAEQAAPEAVRVVTDRHGLEWVLLWVERDEGRDCAVFAQEDRAYLLMRRQRDRGVWSVDTTSIPLFRPTRNEAGNFIDPGDPESTITDGRLFVDTDSYI